MVFSGEPFGAELMAVVVGGDSVVGSGLDEQLEIDSATHAVSPAMHEGCAVRKRRPSTRVSGSCSVWKTSIVATTASVMGFA